MTIKMSRRTPEFAREFSFKEWFGKLNSGLEDQSNEKIYKQAFYNVLGSFLLVIFSVASWGVFMILEPFLKPLLWALLCGSVLHPFKYRISKKMHDWIDFLDNPSIIHLFTDGICFPAYLLNTVTDSSAKFISNHVYGILTIASVAFIHLIVPHLSFGLLWSSFSCVSCVLLNLQKICSSFLVVSTAVGCFSWFTLFKWNAENKELLSILSLFTWFTVLCYATSFIELLQVPLFLVLITLFVAGFVHNLGDSTSEEPSTDTKAVNTTNDQETEVPDVSPRETDNLHRTISQRRRFTSQMSFIGLKADEMNEHIGDQYLYWVGWGCAFVFLTKWWWTPYIVGLQVLFFFSKKICYLVGINLYAQEILTHYVDRISSSVDQEKFQVLFPKSLSNSYKVLFLCKTKILKMLKEYCDTISTVLVILAVIIFVVIAAIFLTMQMYTEGMYLVKVSSKVVNDTLIFNQHFNNIFPENWQNQLDSAFENAYVYGRDIISKMVKKLLNGLSEDKVNEMERLLLELWDRIYQAWLVNTDGKVIGPKVTSDAVYEIWDSFTLNIQKTSELMNMNTIMQFVNNNMTTLSSAMRNVWDFTIDNVSLVLYLLEALLSIVFVSGFTVFTFFIDLVIFLTVLFYLLQSSTEVYKPVEMIAKVSPNYGNKLALAIERSVTEVFMVSSKLSLFYGLYTWFLHNLFQMHIVYVPTVTAAILAAVPMLPTYVVCFPGVLDLWLIQEDSFSALLLALLQFAPTNVVDAAIYEDIHGGHPYLTGLAMAGGVLYFGIEGAIIGPLILCFMLVIINFCASLMQEQTHTSALDVDD